MNKLELIKEELEDLSNHELNIQCIRLIDSGDPSNQKLIKFIKKTIRNTVYSMTKEEKIDLLSKYYFMK